MSDKGRDYLLFLEDILIAVEKIEKYTEGLTFEEFCSYEMAVDAVLRNLEVIGEAAKNIPEGVRNRYHEFEEYPTLAKYKEGDNKDLGFWFIVTGSWLKEKNQKQQTRDRKPNLYINRAKGGVMQRSLQDKRYGSTSSPSRLDRKNFPLTSRMLVCTLVVR